MNWTKATARLMRDWGFTPQSASRALGLAGELGTVRFGNLRITSWDDGTYELKTAYLADSTV